MCLIHFSDSSKHRESSSVIEVHTHVHVFACVCVCINYGLLCIRTDSLYCLESLLVESLQPFLPRGSDY